MDARQALESGDLSRHDYKRVEDRAVDDAIALQRDCGLDVLSDGETRRLVFTGSLIDAVEGIDAAATDDWRETRPTARRT
jgi:5-methyltetrahydropteroyltriglutamate--homocysteine methyltransferase